MEGLGRGEAGMADRAQSDAATPSDSRAGAAAGGRAEKVPARMGRESGSLQSFFRRAPWARIPMDFADRVITARHWIGFADYVNGWRYLRPDSTRLARGIMVLTRPVGARTAALRARSEGFRRFDWAMRRHFWSLIWSMTIAYRYRPRRPWRPRREKPIGMEPPTARHPDFKAEVLRFPDSVPLQEASFGSDLWVEVLHLLQDVYPIMAPNQDRASDDPDERLAQCYTRLFRWIRQPPRWHPDLAAASASHNLLGALALGGPFAKLLQCVDAEKGLYTIDLSHMHEYPVRDGLMRLGCRVNYEVRDGLMVTTDIVYEGEPVKPGEPRWKMVEQIAMASLVTHLTVWRQGMEYHASGLASLPATVYGLPPDHPLRRLMTPHIVDTTSVSYYTHLTLRRTGFDVTGFTFPLDTLFKYYDDGARAFDLSRLDIRIDKERRGIPDHLDYPYHEQALRYYELFESYVRAYVSHYYPTQESLARDAPAHIWFETLDRTIQNGVRGYVPTLDREGLIRLCTVLIYSVVIGHDENSLWDYAVFMPTLVHADGLPMTLGEVQCVSNFQLVVCSAVSDLMSDFSYLALDREGAELMRKMQNDLAALQAEMEADGDTYWRVYPASLKSSVAC